MRILLTNDDGINAQGLLALYRAIKNYGDIIVVAPDGERSSVGHGITLSKPIFKKTIYRDKKLFGYGLSGTPADCVKFALKKIMNKKPDLVISGINLGPNDGCSVYYSGTVAGAREGALMGIPSIALSLDTFTDPDYTYAAKIGALLIKNMVKLLIPKGTFLNVNVPNFAEKDIKGIRVTQQGLRAIHGTIQTKKDPFANEYYWLTGASPDIKKEDGSDTFALKKKYVAITPIQVDTTHHAYLNDLNEALENLTC